MGSRKSFTTLLLLAVLLAMASESSGMMSSLKVFDGKLYALEFTPGVRNCAIISSGDSGKTWDTLTPFINPVQQDLGINDYSVYHDTLYLAKRDGVFKTPVNHYAPVRWSEGINDSGFYSMELRDNVFFIISRNGLYRVTLMNNQWQLTNADIALPDYTYIGGPTTTSDYVYTDSAICLALGYLYVSKDGGHVWNKLPGTDTLFIADYMISVGNRLIMGSSAGGSIFTSDDYGASWMDRFSDCHPCSMPRMFSLFSFSGTLFADGGKGFLASRDSGMTWTITGDSIPGRIYSVVTCGKLVFAATDFGFQISADTCKTWVSPEQYFNIAVERHVPGQLRKETLPVSVAIYNLTGQKVHDGVCSGSVGARLGNGFYIVRQVFSDHTAVGKMLVLDGVVITR